MWSFLMNYEFLSVCQAISRALAFYFNVISLKYEDLKLTALIKLFLYFIRYVGNWKWVFGELLHMMYKEVSANFLL